jgi:putative transposase
VTACTRNRRQVLANTQIHDSFVTFGQRGSNHGAWIGDYVLMPDHVHLFVATDDERITLAKWGKSLKNSLSKTFRQIGIDSPHWEKTFFDHVLRSGESYTSKWEYVRNNPVRAGLVKNPEDWPFMGQIFPLEFRND